ncbi:uncharacterized protein BJ171DRAFT_598748 [Polychytrium aggregatum]|uniref:uncharacterized protein n=1 Tax=Polychytrium aggregatum TaxID=110093 RepID=UPI0022FEB300|nr:uncharacterized protein BJ171DRAFT_598748 [Polychytrium aggregatum]KAI9205179.1 hypothetical protein BJ171DRAFT_598748 [Polychytrium aggregatum]
MPFGQKRQREAPSSSHHPAVASGEVVDETAHDLADISLSKRSATDQDVERKLSQIALLERTPLRPSMHPLWNLAPSQAAAGQHPLRPGSPWTVSGAVGVAPESSAESLRHLSERNPPRPSRTVAATALTAPSPVSPALPFISPSGASIAPASPSALLHPETSRPISMTSSGPSSSSSLPSSLASMEELQAALPRSPHPLAALPARTVDRQLEQSLTMLRCLGISHELTPSGYWSGLPPPPSDADTNENASTSAKADTKRDAFGAFPAVSPTSPRSQLLHVARAASDQRRNFRIDTSLGPRGPVATPSSSPVEFRPSAGSSSGFSFLSPASGLQVPSMSPPSTFSRRGSIGSPPIQRSASTIAAEASPQRSKPRSKPGLKEKLIFERKTLNKTISSAPSRPATLPHRIHHHHGGDRDTVHLWTKTYRPLRIPSVLLTPAGSYLWSGRTPQLNPEQAQVVLYRAPGLSGLLAPTSPPEHSMPHLPEQLSTESRTTSISSMITEVVPLAKADELLSSLDDDVDNGDAVRGPQMDLD